MILFMLVVAFGLLLIASGINPQRTTLSRFELERRHAEGDAAADAIRRRERLLDDILSLQRIVVALLLVIVVALAVAQFGWLLGVVVAVAVALEYGAVARRRVIQQLARKLYVRYENGLLRFVERFPGVFRWLRHAEARVNNDRQPESREELQHLIAQSRSLVSPDEKSLLMHSLQFGARKVGEIMTPRGVIDSIEKKELLGPLVLDDLHKTGHSRFPVIDNDIDHIIGMLYVQDLLSLDIKKSTTAEKAMDPRVYYIHEQQTLQHALAAFLRTHHHLFIVVNEFQETVGIISLEDVLEALIGRKIIDEFDTHTDLRSVAKRNPRGNNHPSERHDV